MNLHSSGVLVLKMTPVLRIRILRVALKLVSFRKKARIVVLKDWQLANGD